MAREVGLIGIMVLMSLLIVAKGDKQMIHILEGKLFKNDMDMAIAAKAFQRHKKFSSVILFMAGFAAIAVSVIFLTDGNSAFPVSAALSVILIDFGIWGRISSFCAADRDLGAAIRSHPVESR